MDFDDLSPDNTSDSESSYVPSENERELPQLYLGNFLDWTPLPLKCSRDHTKSYATKPPLRFDLHMHDLLKLKKVELLPDLTERLSLLCDEYISKEDASYLTFGDVVESGFTRVIAYQDVHQEDETKEDGKMYYESSVVQAVGTITGNPCSIVSSTLLFNLSKWQPVLFWSQKPSTAATKGFAQADAFVYVDRNLVDECNLSDEHKRHVHLIYLFGLQNFLLWEFKSLKAAGLDVMKDIIAQAEEPVFRWTTCKTGRLDNEDMVDALDCNHENHSVDGRWAVTGHAVGFDAADPKLVMHVPLDPDIIAPIPTQVDTANNLLGELGPYDADDQYEFQTPKDSNTIHENTASSTTSRLVHTDGLELPPSRSMKRSPARRNSSADDLSMDRPSPSKKMRTGPASDLSHPSSSDASKVQQKKTLGKKLDDPKARYILQQAWGEMVNNDATYLVISSGNFEIIAIRNREKQTMYLSPILEPPEDTDIPHTKVMTSLFIGAYRDAVDRAMQMSTMMLSPREIWPPRMNLLFDKPGNMKDKSDADQSVNMRDAINDKLSTAIRNAGYLMCNLPNSLSGLTKHKHGYCRPYNIRALRNIANNSDTGLSLWLSVKDPSTIQGARIVHYTLNHCVNGTQSLQCYTGGLIMKFAETLDDKRRLEHEYRTYEMLLAKGVRNLPKMFGIFSFDANPGVLGLLMENCGFSLAYWREQAAGQKMLEKNREVIAGALDSLHRSGHVHGSVIADHVLVTSSGTPCIVSLSRCSKFSDSATKPLRKSLSTDSGPSFSVSSPSATKTDADRRAEVVQLQKLLILRVPTVLEAVMEEDASVNTPTAGPSRLL